jgi:hypothetical protein
MAYVYAIVVDGKRRYIGKGSGKRHLTHMQMVRSIARRRAAGEVIETSRLYKELTKAWLAGRIIETVILFDGLSDEAALDLEEGLITEGKGLWNTFPFSLPGPGGLAHRAATSSASFRALQSVSGRRKWADAEYRQRTQEAMRKAAAAPEEKVRKSAATARTWTGPAREKRRVGISAAATKRYVDAPYNQVLALVRSTPGLTQKDIMAQLGFERTVVKLILSRLVRRTLVERRGAYHGATYIATNVVDIAS